MVLKGGSHPWHGIGNIGVISLTHYLLFIAGLIIGKRRIRERGLILLSLFFSLLPAVVTVDSPHVTRSLLFLVLTALVATQKISSWKKILPMVVLGILIELLVFSYRYLYLFPTQMHPSWPKGLEAAINQANQKKQPGQLVEITNQRDLRSDVLADQAYIYVALYSQSKPTLKWTEQLKDSAGMVRVSSLNDYRFVNQGSPTDPNSIRIERSADGWYQLKEE